MKRPRLRFAPSPTGYLHIGGARTALFNWLWARKTGGTFILRIEDSDQERSTAESRAAIFDSLRWLGLEWDEGPSQQPGGMDRGTHGPYTQMQRLSLDVTLVARGRDHMINTPPQILLYQAFGADVPEFAHLPMMLAPSGEKLSKRHGASTRFGCLAAD